LKLKPAASNPILPPHQNIGSERATVSLPNASWWACRKIHGEPVEHVMVSLSNHKKDLKAY